MAAEGFGAPGVVVSAARVLTVTVRAAEVEPENPSAPLYTAVTWCAPSVLNACERVALPPVTATGAPMAVAPSLNCTVPPPGAGLTVAVRSTDAPLFAVSGAARVVPVATSGAETVPVCGAEVDCR